MLTGPFDKRMGTNYRMPLVVGLLISLTETSSFSWQIETA